MNISRALKDLIAPISPHLVDRVKKLIEESEMEYARRPTERQDSFLWEHTLHVSSIARQICHNDSIEPAAPVIAALFHDAGKFYFGEYHKDEIPEEEVSASLAQKILVEEGVAEHLIREIVEGLNALYCEGSPDNKVSGVVHDADFLAKTGHLGVANFFMKGTLRGQNLYRSLIQSLSQELTYASMLPENMRTEAGRKMALGKRRITMRFFRELLHELSDHGIERFEITETFWPCPTNPQKMITVRMVLPEKCPECGGPFTAKYSSEKGVKCTMIVADIQCGHCPNNYRISFCLPEICS